MYYYQTAFANNFFPGVYKITLAGILNSEPLQEKQVTEKKGIEKSI